MNPSPTALANVLRLVPSEDNGGGKPFCTLLLVIHDANQLVQALTRLGYRFPLPEAEVVGGEAVVNAKGESDSETKDGLVNCGISYDLSEDLLRLESGKQLPLPARFVPVFRNLLDPHLFINSASRSFASCEEIGEWFYGGRLLAKNPNVSADDIETRKEAFAKTDADWKEIAREFRRDLGRWAVENGIARSALIVCDRRRDGYKLGPGWSKEELVIGLSSVSSLAGHDYERDDEVRRGPARVGSREHSLSTS